MPRGGRRRDREGKRRGEYGEGKGKGKWRIGRDDGRGREDRERRGEKI